VIKLFENNLDISRYCSLQTLIYIKNLLYSKISKLAKYLFSKYYTHPYSNNNNENNSLNRKIVQTNTRNQLISKSLIALIGVVAIVSAISLFNKSKPPKLNDLKINDDIDLIRDQTDICPATFSSEDISNKETGQTNAHNQLIPNSLITLIEVAAILGAFSFFNKMETRKQSDSNNKELTKAEELYDLHWAFNPLNDTLDISDRVKELPGLAESIYNALEKTKCSLEKLIEVTEKVRNAYRRAIRYFPNDQSLVEKLDKFNAILNAHKILKIYEALEKTKCTFDELVEAAESVIYAYRRAIRYFPNDQSLVEKLKKFTTTHNIHKAVKIYVAHKKADSPIDKLTKAAKNVINAYERAIIIYPEDRCLVEELYEFYEAYEKNNCPIKKLIELTKKVKNAYDHALEAFPKDRNLAKKLNKFNAILQTHESAIEKPDNNSDIVIARNKMDGASSKNSSDDTSSTSPNNDSSRYFIFKSNENKKLKSIRKRAEYLWKIAKKKSVVFKKSYFKTPIISK